MNKPQVQDSLHIYCVGGTRQKLKELAQAERRSLSAQVQQLIEEAHARRFGTKPETKPK